MIDRSDYSHGTKTWDGCGMSHVRADARFDTRVSLNRGQVEPSTVERRFGIDGVENVYV